jgi:hypothetical protein
MVGGLTLTTAQLLLIYICNDIKSFTTFYLRLYQHDSYWYGRIVEFGYHSAIPPGGKNFERDNVAFFPGFPLFATLVKGMTGLSTKVSILLTGQLACWWFWMYLLLLLQRWRVGRWPAAIAVVLVFSHPCAFFLVAGYSESLFLATLLGYLYWSERQGGVAWWMAAAHGCVMTGTRIVGLPIALAPLLLILNRSDQPADRMVGIRRLSGLTAVACLGGLGFFAYCDWRFGHWDLYMWTQHTGWGIKPDYLAVFRPDVYRLFVPSDGVDGFVDPGQLSRLAVPLTLALLGGLLGLEGWQWCVSGGSRKFQRAPLHFAAWCMFYISVSGLVAVGMNSMIRYTLPMYVPLVLAGAHLLSRHPPQGIVSDISVLVLTLAVADSLLLQGELADHFVLGDWVA